LEESSATSQELYTSCVSIENNACARFKKMYVMFNSDNINISKQAGITEIYDTGIKQRKIFGTGQTPVCE